MSATSRHFDNAWCKGKNRWCSVDVHFQTGGETWSRSFLRVKATYMLVINNSDQINIELPYLQHQKLLTLRWRSFSEWGSDRVTSSVASKGCQYCYYIQPLQTGFLMTWLTGPKINHPPLTFMFMMGQRRHHALICPKRPPVLST